MMEDLVLAGRVRCALVEALDIHGLEVEVNQGTAEVMGYVSRAEDKEHAVALAKAVGGVKTISVGLEVSPSLVDRLS